MPPAQALGVILPLYMLIDVAALPSYWRKWDAASARWIVIGAVPGVALGARLYTQVEADAFRVLIGAICLAFVGYQAARALGWLSVRAWPFSRWGAGGAGAVAGFTSFVSHAGGPPVAVWLLGRGLDKTRYQATTVLVFWAINILKFGPYAVLGIFTAHTLWIDLLLAPAALAGAWLGVKAHHLIPERAFFALTYVLLVATGLRLIQLGLG